jgi:hypothetical protein
VNQRIQQALLKSRIRIRNTEKLNGGDEISTAREEKKEIFSFLKTKSARNASALHQQLG